MTPPSSGRRRAVVEIDGTLPAHQRLRWRFDDPPILSVPAGTELLVRVPDSSTGQMDRDSTREDLRTMDLARVDAAVGPIDVTGAEPGDALRIEILDIRPGVWGWSGIFAEFGLLRGRFEDDLVLWSVGQRWATPSGGFLRPVTVPVAPMLGWIGVAPAAGDLGMIPPQVHGGNLDNRLHRAGTVLELPVQRPGAGLMIGDPHAAQGDGEVCGTGIEASAIARLRVGIEKDRRLAGPRAWTETPDGAEGPWYICEGVASDPKTAAIAAVEEGIRTLVELGATEPEAYVVLSVAGHLRWSEIVDEPNHVVSMLIPRRIAEQFRTVPAREAVKSARGPPGLGRRS